MLTKEKKATKYKIFYTIEPGSFQLQFIEKYNIVTIRTTAGITHIRSTIYTRTLLYIFISDLGEKDIQLFEFIKKKQKIGITGLEVVRIYLISETDEKSLSYESTIPSELCSCPGKFFESSILENVRNHLKNAFIKQI